MKKALIFLSVLILHMLQVSCADESHWYFGFGYFANYAEIDDEDINADRVSQGKQPIDAGGNSFMAPTIRLGWRWNPQWSFQGDYVHRIQFDNEAYCFILCGVDPLIEYELDVSLLDLSAKYSFRDGRFIPFAIAGGSYLKEAISIDGFDSNGARVSLERSSQTEFTWHVGIGFEWRFSKLFGLQLAHSRYGYEGLAKTSLTWNVHF